MAGGGFLVSNRFWLKRNVLLVGQEIFMRETDLMLPQKGREIFPPQAMDEDPIPFKTFIHGKWMVKERLLFCNYGTPL